MLLAMHLGPNKNQLEEASSTLFSQLPNWVSAQNSLGRLSRNLIIEPYKNTNKDKKVLMLSISALNLHNFALSFGKNIILFIYNKQNEEVPGL